MAGCTKKCPGSVGASAATVSSPDPWTRPSSLTRTQTHQYHVASNIRSECLAAAQLLAGSRRATHRKGVGRLEAAHRGSQSGAQKRTGKLSLLLVFDLT